VKGDGARTGQAGPPQDTNFPEARNLRPSVCYPRNYYRRAAHGGTLRVFFYSSLARNTDLSCRLLKASHVGENALRARVVARVNVYEGSSIYAILLYVASGCDVRSMRFYIIDAIYWQYSGSLSEIVPVAIAKAGDKIVSQRGNICTRIRKSAR